MELEETAALLEEGGGVVVAERLERLDDEGRARRGPVDPPLAIDETIDQKGADPAGDESVGGVGDDPAPVVVREGDVVVLGQEPRRRRRVRVGARCIGQVEELAAGLVAERPELRSEPLDDLPQAGQPRPRPDVRDGRRTECREIAEDGLVECGIRTERPRQPGLERRPGRSTRPAPDASRRQLDDR